MAFGSRRVAFIGCETNATDDDLIDALPLFVSPLGRPKSPAAQRQSVRSILDAMNDVIVALAIFSEEALTGLWSGRHKTIVAKPIRPQN
jgi:hypothetical protein